jgi:hypothetical protein
MLILTTLNSSFGKTVAEMGVSYYIVGEITNTNPYSIFLAVPSEINNGEKTLLKPHDSLEGDVSPVVEPIGNDYYEHIFNGKEGLWVPPYTTVKIYMDWLNTSIYTITVDDSQDNYDIVGPIVVNKVIKSYNIKELFPDSKQKGIKIGKFKLYVSGYIVKSDETESLSIVLPAPVILEDYDEFHKIVGINDPDVWISYNEWFKNQLKRKNIDLNTDDPLVPKMGFDIDIGYKTSDVPAMAFTTSSNQPIEFSYVMYYN